METTINETTTITVNTDGVSVALEAVETSNPTPISPSTASSASTEVMSDATSTLADQPSSEDVVDTQSESQPESESESEPEPVTETAVVADGISKTAVKTRTKQLRQSRTSVRLTDLEYVKLKAEARRRHLEVAGLVRTALGSIISEENFVCDVCQFDLPADGMGQVGRSVVVCRGCLDVVPQIFFHSEYPDKILEVIRMQIANNQRTCNWDRGVTVLTEDYNPRITHQNSLHRHESMESAIRNIRSLCFSGSRVLEVFQDGKPLKLNIDIDVKFSAMPANGKAAPVETDGSLLDP